MIKRNERNIEMKFGTGDINILTGYINESELKVTGYIGYRNQAPREIGLFGGDNAKDIKCLEDMPIVMTFDKVESVDVMIDALKEIRGYIKKEDD